MVLLHKITSYWGLDISGFTLGVQVLINTPGLVEQSHYNQLYTELFIAYFYYIKNLFTDK